MLIPTWVKKEVWVENEKFFKVIWKTDFYKFITIFFLYFNNIKLLLGAFDITSYISIENNYNWT